MCDIEASKEDALPLCTQDVSEFLEQDREVQGVISEVRHAQLVELGAQFSVPRAAGGAAWCHESTLQ